MHTFAQPKWWGNALKFGNLLQPYIFRQVLLYVFYISKSNKYISSVVDRDRSKPGLFWTGQIRIWIRPFGQKISLTQFFQICLQIGQIRL
jgi:hypothetical protein